MVSESDTPVNLAAAACALRMLARLMLRAALAKGDPVANPRESRSSSTLTVVPQPRPHQRDDAA